MYPVLFSLGPLQIHSFGTMVALGVLLSLYLMTRQAKRDGFPPHDQVFDDVFVVILSGFIGARIYYIIQHWTFYRQTPIAMVAIWEGGLVFYGGVIGAFLGFALWMKKKKIPVLKGLDYILIYVTLTHAFGRIGCFLNACCSGVACDLPWAVVFPGETEAVHPTQLYEAGFLLILFLFLYFRYPRKKFEGEIALLYFIFYAFARFVIEFFRAGNPVLFYLTSNQWASLAVMAVAAGFYQRKCCDRSAKSHS